MGNSISWDVFGVNEVVDRLSTLGTIVELTMAIRAEEVRREIEQIIVDKLSGAVLHRGTGALVDSVYSEVTSDGGNVSITWTAGEGVPYAWIHEKGGIIDHPGGTAYIIGSGGATFISNAVAAKLGGNMLRTKPHKIPMPERSYMQSTLEENEQAILDEFRQVILDATI